MSVLTTIRYSARVMVREERGAGVIPTGGMVGVPFLISAVLVLGALVVGLILRQPQPAASEPAAAE